MYPEAVVVMIILFAFLMVSHVEYESMPDRFDTGVGRIKLAALVIAGIALVLWPSLLLFPYIAAYILLGMIKEFARLTTRGMDRMAAHGYRPFRDRERDTDE